MVKRFRLLFFCGLQFDEIFIFLRYKDNVYYVRFVQERLLILFDGENIEVSPSQFLKARACGLCGDLDHENTADLKVRIGNICLLSRLISAIKWANHCLLLFFLFLQLYNLLIKFSDPSNLSYIQAQIRRIFLYALGILQRNSQPRRTYKNYVLKILAFIVWITQWARKF